MRAFSLKITKIVIVNFEEDVSRDFFLDVQQASLEHPLLCIGRLTLGHTIYRPTNISDNLFELNILFVDFYESSVLYINTPGMAKVRELNAIITLFNCVLYFPPGCQIDGERQGVSIQTQSLLFP